MKRYAVRWESPLCAQNWQSENELDAWIAYKTWRQALNNNADFVPLTGTPAALRLTTIAITT